MLVQVYKSQKTQNVQFVDDWRIIRIIGEK